MALHIAVVSGPDGATGWCEACQQYCGGQNASGPIRCACCPAPRKGRDGAGDPAWDDPPAEDQAD